MVWDDSPQGGFTTGEPWLPLGAGWQERNVANELAAPGSMLALHRALLGLRRTSPALATGSIRLIEAEGSVLAYERELDGERFVIALNLGNSPAPADLPDGTPLLSTLGDLPIGTPSLLRPDEGLILKVDTPA
jgi:alpha-glucosidase